MLAIYDIVHNHELTLLGPPSSFALPGGRMFFFGPLIYYVPIPAVIMFGWNALVISYYLILVQFGAFMILLYALKRRFGFKTAIFFGIIFALSPTMVNFSRFLWNANLLIPICCLLLAAHLFLPATGRIKNFGLILAIGILWGLGFQAHYSFVIVSICSFIALVRQKLVSLKHLVLIVLGFCIGFSPLIVFDLKHRFYNAETMVLYLLSQINGKNSAPGSWAIQYFLFIFPFAFFGAARLLNRIWQSKRIIVIPILVVYIYWSLSQLLPKPSHGYLTPEGLSYTVLSSMRDHIISENKPDSSVIDVITGDARASYLRALLTYSGHPPTGVSEYPIAKTIYIVSKTPLKEVLKSDQWEVRASANSKFVKQWNYPYGVYLFELSRKSSNEVTSQK